MKQQTGSSVTSTYLASFFVLLSFLIAGACAAQEKYKISKPLDLKQKGNYSVLCMKNGNTLLFHFESMKKVRVVVFDTMRKLVAVTADDCRVLDVFDIENATVKGLFDINGEAVLFFDEEILGKHCLIRLRYNGTTGKLIDEKLVAESKGAGKRMQFSVMKNREVDNYAILFYTVIEHPVLKCDLFVVYYNSRHESVKEVTLNVDRKKYDYLKVLGAQAQPNGIMITLGLDKTTVYGQADHHRPFLYRGSVYDHYISFYYIPKETLIPKKRTIDVSEDVYPAYAFYTYNPFTETLNSLLFAHHPYDGVVDRINSCHFFKISPQDMSVGFGRIKDSIANDFLKQQTDSFNFMYGIPQRMYTNENGLSTVISLAQSRYEDFDKYNRNGYLHFSEYLGITQFDDDGREIWGTVLPFTQYFHSSSPFEKNFLSEYTCKGQKSIYIIYNDYDANFKNTLRNPGSPVYYFDMTNAFYYQINSKKEVIKRYLFGKPGKRECLNAVIESADFDMERNTYASLVRYNKRGKITMNMAWSQLE